MSAIKTTPKLEEETALEALADAILLHKRLAWMVVSKYLEANGYVLAEEAEQYQLLQRMLPNIPIIETYHEIKQSQ